MRPYCATVALSFLAMVASFSAAATIQVGPTRTYKTIQAGVNAAADGDTVQIDSGTYSQSAGWATITRNNLIIQGVGATRPILDAAGKSLNSKAIFIIQGTNTTVDFIEFKNCKCSSKNGAGIRQEGATLTIRNSYFHDNQDGILVNAVVGSNILVETTEFYNNGAGDGQSHNMYINAVDQFTLRYCWSHHANVGHEVKTRAKVNYILYNRLGNEGGNGSFECSACQGGTTYVIGNQIEQSATTSNGTMIDYASEGELNPDSHLYVVNNTVVNNRTSGTNIFVNNYATTGALLENNIFQGIGTVLNGVGTQTTNWATSNAYLANPATFDFHLTSSSTGAINLGTTPGTGINGFNMNPVYQYVHPCSYQTRPVNGTIDIGSYEY